MFFDNNDGQKLDEPDIIWKTKKSRRLQNMRKGDFNQLLCVHYFSNNKAWIDSEIMEEVLQK